MDFFFYVSHTLCFVGLPWPCLSPSSVPDATMMSHWLYHPLCQWLKLPFGLLMVSFVASYYIHNTRTHTHLHILNYIFVLNCLNKLLNMPLLIRIVHFMEVKYKVSLSTYTMRADADGEAGWSIYVSLHCLSVVLWFRQIKTAVV